MKKVFVGYSIVFDEDYFSVQIGSQTWFTLPVFTAVDTDTAEDIDRTALHRTVEEQEDRILVTYYGGSNLWEEKIYRITADADGFHYTVQVKGHGRVRRLRYFTGRPVHYAVSGYLRPVAEHKNRRDCTCNIFEEGEIGLGYFAPPPFVFPFFTEGETGWFGLGLTARPGQYNFDRFLLKRGLQLELPLYNRTLVNGTWEAQGIWGGAGADAMDVVAAYSEWHYRSGLCERHADYAAAPAWWKGPIFCGWGEQQTLAGRTGGAAIDFATQAEYTQMLQTLREQKLHPRIVIIDAKWQQGYGNLTVDTQKWPDLRAFTDAAHAQGIRVLLWIRSFNAEGLPHEECVKLLTNPIAADPTCPAFIERTRRDIRTLLSDAPGCCNCDGFKVDFINCIPLGENIQTYEPGIYGTELVKRWLQLVHTAAKAAKADALVNISCAHPYLAAESDQIRLHDYHGELNSACSVMGYRAEVVKAVYPGVTIDCDSGGTFSHRDFLRYMRYQPQIGVPDLYWLSASGDVPFDAEDFAAIRTAWAAYEK